MVYDRSGIKIYNGDCLEVMRTLDENSVDSVVTDPPYGLVEPRSGGQGSGQAFSERTEERKESRRGGFMGKKWDACVPGIEFWVEALRVAKPGAYLLAFGGTRTVHRLTCAIEDAGWEIRDCLMWVYGSGFPKSMDVSKQIDKTFGVEREVVGEKYAGIARQCRNGGEIVGGVSDNEKKYIDVTAPATDDAKKFSGYGTALKPAYEPIILARKPLIGTVVQNVLKYGTGGINIDACRIGTEVLPEQNAGQAKCGTFERQNMVTPERTGRWPANLILSHAADCRCVGVKNVRTGTYIGRNRDENEIGNTILSPRHKDTNDAGYANADGTEEIESWECVADCPIRMLDEQAGPQTSGGTPARRFAAKTKNAFGDFNGEENPDGIGSSSGNVSRFFYCAKADKSERRQSKHPTVKPLDLMRYLVRLVTPVGGVVLDPFLGSGTTIEAAREEHCKAIGIDLSEEYCADAVDRLTQGVFNFSE